MRDGYIEINGLKADFRFVRQHPHVDDEVKVATAVGEYWVQDMNLHWDNTTQEKPQVKCECHEKPCR